MEGFGEMTRTGQALDREDDAHGMGTSADGLLTRVRTSERRRRSHQVRVANGMRTDASEALRRERSRHHRICDLGRRACGDCDYRDHCFQAKAARALGCDIQWDKRLIADERGQSTVEYAIVFSALLCVLAGIGALMGVLDGGVFVHHAVTSASHCVQSSLTGLTDTLCF